MQAVDVEIVSMLMGGPKLIFALRRVLVAEPAVLRSLGDGE